jgi:hypothetical protein
MKNYIPQILIIVLLAAGLTLNGIKHGEERTGKASKYNFLSALFAVIIELLILYWGGFFK